MNQDSKIALLLSFLIFNTFKKREGIRSMFIIPKTLERNEDPFDCEKDFFDNRITESYFWEAIILKKHFLSEIRFVF